MLGKSSVLCACRQAQHYRVAGTLVTSWHSSFSSVPVPQLNSQGWALASWCVWGATQYYLTSQLGCLPHPSLQMWIPHCSAEKGRPLHLYLRPASERTRAALVVKLASLPFTPGPAFSHFQHGDNGESSWGQLRAANHCAQPSCSSLCWIIHSVNSQENAATSLHIFFPSPWAWTMCYKSYIYFLLRQGSCGCLTFPSNENRKFIWAFIVYSLHSVLFNFPMYSHVDLAFSPLWAMDNTSTLETIWDIYFPHAAQQLQLEIEKCFQTFLLKFLSFQLWPYHCLYSHSHNSFSGTAGKREWKKGVIRESSLIHRHSDKRGLRPRSLCLAGNFRKASSLDLKILRDGKFSMFLLFFFFFS